MRSPRPKSIVFCDEHSLDRTVDHLVSFDAGRVSARYPGPYSTYQALCAEETAGKHEAARQRPEPIPQAEQSPSRPRKLSYKEQRELEQIEARIEALEAEKESLQEAINSSSDDYLRLQTLAETLYGG